MRGQSLIEFGLMVPTLVLLLAVVADFARVFYTAIEVADAARAGVQYGAQSYLTAVQYSAIQQAALNDGSNVSGLTASASDFCECSNSVVSCTAPGCTEPQVFVQVTTNATYQTLWRWPGIPASIPLSSTAVMEVKP